MSTFKERLVLEKEELDEKIGKLNSFVNSVKFHEADDIQQSLLQIQLHAMRCYGQTLGERLRYL